MTSQRDRIESLESRIEELEATVRGLTEELVDTHQRLRDLEAAEEEGATANEVEEDKSEQTKEESDDEGASDLGDDIIVA